MSYCTLNCRKQRLHLSPPLDMKKVRKIMYLHPRELCTQSGEEKGGKKLGLFGGAGCGQEQRARPQICPRASAPRFLPHGMSQALENPVPKACAPNATHHHRKKRRVTERLPPKGAVSNEDQIQSQNHTMLEPKDTFLFFQKFDVTNI